jgi:hypothetical protein
MRVVDKQAVAGFVRMLIFGERHLRLVLAD